ncbi:MAG: NAD-dependent epimerase/dehydratase family protein [Phycisphaerales bacterium]
MGGQEQDREHDGTPRRVLVTGGAGFIGSHLVEHLLSLGDEVTIIDNLSTGRMRNLEGALDRVRFIEASVSEGLPRLGDDEFDEIYHLAAAVGVELVLSDPVGSIRSNVIETDAVLRFALEHGKAKVLVASSSEVYGKPGTSVFSEGDDLLLGPTTVTRWSYAHAKAIDEHLAIGYAHQYGLDTVCCRFFNTVGPRQIGRYGMVLPRFVQAASRGEPLQVYGDGTQTRCFCDGRDVAHALPALLRADARTERVFNLGSDRPITILDLAKLVIRTLNSTSAIDFIPYDVAYPVGFEDLRHRKPDLDRIRAAIGFDPSYSIEHTVRDLFAQMQSEIRVEGGAS